MLKHYFFTAAATVALLGAVSLGVAAEQKPLLMMEHPDATPQEQVEKAQSQEDHEALAQRFDAEAKKLDEDAARHEQLAQQYGHRQGVGPKGNAASLAQHCNNLVRNLKASAQDAREMARLHRELGKSLAK